MSTVELAVRLFAGFLLIAANAFFVAVEFGLTRLPEVALDPDEAGGPGLERGMQMLDRLEIHLTGCQLGISTSSVLLGVVAEPAVTALIAPAVGLFGIGGGSVHGVSVVVAVVLLNLVHKIWGEQAPTYLGVERPREVVERLAPALSWWSRSMHPVIKAGDGLAKWTLGLFGVEITRSWTQAEAAGEEDRPVRGRRELKRRMAALLGASSELPEDRRQEVIRALEIDEISVREVMVGAGDMVLLALEAPPDENRRRIARGGFVRYPVVRRDPGEGEPVRRDEVAGVLYLPRLFDPPDRLRRDDPGLPEILDDPVFLSPHVSVASLIDRLQEERQEAALIVEHEEVVGFVTVTDALEAVAGEVRDPLDP